MDLQLAGKVVVVSGGCHGIGRAIVDAFLAEGARVVLVDRDVGAGDALASTRPADVVFCGGDLANEDTSRRTIELAVERFRGIDVLVNNAASNDSVGVAAGASAFVASLRANLVHCYSLVQFALPHLRTARGAIVNIGSKVAVTGQGGTSGYAAAKGALLALTREWAVELAPAGVRVNAVLPAEVWTGMYAEWLERQPDPAAQRARIERSIPLGRRFTTPQEIADTVVFVASGRSSHTTGQVLFVDGGYTHLDRRSTLP
ncbi:MAG: SDR family oxidoreductase [Planctomycetota bacterium]